MKHGFSGSPTYFSWGGMIQRCNNPNYTHYDRYGGRGITVCDRWLDFTNFLADMGERPNGLTLDRVDNDDGYSPKNCRRATRKEQSNNRSECFYTLKGATKSWADWFKHYNIKRSTFDQRVYVYKWSIIKALTTPVGKRG